ncbi:MAG: three-Cys-motif partner protein TcmP [Actinomycetota bacterium]
MTHPNSVLWKRDPHTAAKHEILRRYLQAWWPILLQNNWVRKLTFLDGFAGPGEYECGAEGSPCIALRTLLERTELIGSRSIEFIFIEESKKRKEHLEQLLSATFPELPKWVSISIECGTFETAAQRLLTESNSWGSPIFANLDTWGVGDIPYDIVSSIARNISSEVLATFLPEWFLRFGNPQDSTIMTRGNQQFASDSWIRALAVADSDERERVLVDEYQKTLRNAGMDFAMPFAFSNAKDYTLYLVFGTCSKAGVTKMKDSMWKIDPVEGTSFKDPRDPNQLMLGFNEPNLASLRSDVVEALFENGPLTVEDLRELFFSTMYKQAHLTEALKQLRELGQLDQDPRGKALTKNHKVWLR